MRHLQRLGLQLLRSALGPPHHAPHAARGRQREAAAEARAWAAVCTPLRRASLRHRRRPATPPAAATATTAVVVGVGAVEVEFKHGLEDVRGGERAVVWGERARPLSQRVQRG